MNTHRNTHRNTLTLENMSRAFVITIKRDLILSHSQKSPTIKRGLVEYVFTM